MCMRICRFFYSERNSSVLWNYMIHCQLANFLSFFQTVSFVVDANLCDYVTVWLYDCIIVHVSFSIDSSLYGQAKCHCCDFFRLTDKISNEWKYIFLPSHLLKWVRKSKNSSWRIKLKNLIYIIYCKYL